MVGQIQDDGRKRGREASIHLSLQRFLPFHKRGLQESRGRGSSRLLGSVDSPKNQHGVHHGDDRSGRGPEHLGFLRREHQPGELPHHRSLRSALRSARRSLQRDREQAGIPMAGGDTKRPDPERTEPGPKVRLEHSHYRPAPQ